MSLAAPAYVAEPKAGAASATVLVIHEIFGLTPHIRDVCDRLAAEGYVAIAPDLFRSALDGACLPYTAEGKKQGVAIKNGIGEPALAQLALEFISHPSRTGPIALMGFCLGGAIAWLGARDARVAAAVGYYSVGLGRHLDHAPSAPVLLHFGRHDPSIPAAEVQAVAAAFPDVEIHQYDAGHAFNRDDDAPFVPAAAREAWARTLAFLQHHLKDHL